MFTDMVAGLQFLNCSNLTTDQLLSANLAKGLSGTVCCLITLVLLFILVFALHSYRGILQRLILYYATVTLFYQVLNAALLEHQFYYREQNIVCAVIGGLRYYVANVMVILAAVIINYLMCLVLRSSKSNSHTTSKWRVWITECCCVGLPIILPLTYLWPPLTDNRFGISGPNCGIIMTDKDCKPVYRDLIINYSFTELTVLEMFVVVIITLIAYCRIRMHVSVKNINVLVQKTYFLLILYATIFVVNTVLLVVFTLKETYFLALADAIWFPFFFEFTFFVLFMVSARISEKCLPHTQRKVQFIGGDQTKHCKTNPTSHPVIQPSQTYFSIPYTGGFTEITVSNVKSTSMDQGNEEERSLLIETEA